MKKKIITLFLFAFFHCLLGFGQNFSTVNLKKYISFLASDSLEGRSTGSKGAQIAGEYIAQQFKQIGLAPYFQEFSFKFNPNPHDTLNTSLIPLTGQNVAAFLNNDRPKTIIIGAHYDHLGLGHDGNSMDSEAKGKIHNGADDNASGVAGMLELARFYANNGINEEVNFYFIAFSGEENGLFGSKSIADFLLDQNQQNKEEIKKLKTASDCKIMINLDMIGRVKPEEKKVMIYGTGTAINLQNIVNSIELKNYKLVTDSSGVGPSDHASFYFKNIPVLHFFSGQHADYHKPSDDEPLINYQGITEILDYIVRLNNSIEKTDLVFSPTRNNLTTSRNFKVTLGIMPDYTFEGPGLRIDGVSENKPAKKAGLIKGDIILKIDQTEITNIKVYMSLLSKYNKGEKVAASVKRGNEIIKLDIIF